MFIDDILDGGFDVPGKAPDPAFNSVVMADLEQGVVVDATNVALWYLHEHEQLGLEDLPNLAPPWPRIWLEVRADEFWRSYNYPRRWGILITSLDWSDDEPGWSLGVDYFVDHDYYGPRAALTGFMTITVEPDGRPTPGQGLPVIVSPVDQNDADVGHIVVPTMALLGAICFAHCKNVERAEHHPTRQTSRANQRRHGRPLVKWWTLDIDPMRRVLETEGGESSVGKAKALHICRGHFKTFTEDEPLFGQHVGTYW